MSSSSACRRLAALLLILAACSVGAPRTCERDADCGMAASCAQGLCVASFAKVHIKSPAETLHTNGVAHIEVAIANGRLEEVELTANGVSLARLDSTLTYRWDTTTVPEGSYEIVASATIEGERFSSEPRTVVVDRTPPTVVELVPTPGNDNVKAGTPFVATFSEQMRAESVNHSSVLMTGNDGVALSKSLEISRDGKQVAISLARGIVQPVRVNIEMLGVADLAGNVMVLLPEPWKFTVPDWWHPWPLPVNHDSAKGAWLGALALDPLGSPIVAFIEEVATSQLLFVRAWDGLRWRDLGGPLNVVGGAWSPALAIANDGTPFVAWFEYIVGAPGSYYVFSARWNGTAWTNWNGSALSVQDHFNVNLTPNPPARLGVPAITVALVMGPNGSPVLAWPELVGSGTAAAYHSFLATVREGRVKKTAGANPAAGRSTHYVSLGVLGSRILLAVVDEDEAEPRKLGDLYLHSVGPDWAAVPYGSDAANLGRGGVFGPASVAVAAGVPSLAFTAQTQQGTSNVFVEAWSTLAGWVPVGGALELDATRNAFGPSLFGDVKGRLLVAWHNSIVPGSIEVKQWDRSVGWTSVGGVLANLGARHASLAVASDGMPIIGWEDDSGIIQDHSYVFNVLVAKLNR